MSCTEKGCPFPAAGGFCDHHRRMFSEQRSFMGSTLPQSERRSKEQELLQRCVRYRKDHEYRERKRLYQLRYRKRHAA